MLKKLFKPRFPVHFKILALTFLCNLHAEYDFIFFLIFFSTEERLILKIKSSIDSTKLTSCRFCLPYHLAIIDHQRKIYHIL